MATETADQHLAASHDSAPSPSETLSPLEQEVLDEYARLLGNLNHVCTSLFTHTSPPLSFLFVSLPSSSPQQYETDESPFQMSTILAELAANPSAEILDALRGLERKTSLVFTLLKASVYSIVLNQQIEEEDGEGGGGV